MPFLNIPLPIRSDFKTKFDTQEILGVEHKRLCDDPIKCGRQVFAGLFFDGTGNNKNFNGTSYAEDSEPIEKNTNVTRLYRAYPHLPNIIKNKRYFSYYVPGVGTPFPKMGEDTVSPTGNPFGGMGQVRILWGMIQTLNFVHQGIFGRDEYLIPDAEAKTIVMHGMSVGDYSKSAMLSDELLNKSLDLIKKKNDELITKLKSKLPLKITQVNLSVFGFSRGAAQARSFLNQLHKLFGGSEGIAVGGVPVQVDFLGIFDTVASVGIADMAGIGWAAMGGHLGWGKPELLKIPAFVGKCVHLVAGQEARASFPVDLVRQGGGYPGNCDEYVFPGAHSDVGGGYLPNLLGNTHNDLQRIPGQFMYFEARKAGVPLMAPVDSNAYSATDIDPLPGSVVQALSIPAQMAKVFNDYVEHMRPVLGGSAESQINAYYKAMLMKRLAPYGSYVPFDDISEQLEYIGFQQNENFDCLRISQASIIAAIINYSNKIGQQVSVKIEPERLIGDFTAVFGGAAAGATALGGILGGGGVMLGGPAGAIGGASYVMNINSNVKESIAVLLETCDFTQTFESQHYSDHFQIEANSHNMLGLHDSGAGFVDQLRKAAAIVKYGEYSINSMGLLRYRRVYAGSAESTHIQPISYENTRTHKQVLTHINRAYYSGIYQLDDNEFLDALFNDRSTTRNNLPAVGSDIRDQGGFPH